MNSVKWDCCNQRWLLEGWKLQHFKLLKMKVVFASNTKIELWNRIPHQWMFLDHAWGHALRNNHPQSIDMHIEKKILKPNHKNTHDQLLLKSFLSLVLLQDLQPSITGSVHLYRIHNLWGTVSNKQNTVLNVEGDNDN